MPSRDALSALPDGGEATIAAFDRLQTLIEWIVTTAPDRAAPIFGPDRAPVPTLANAELLLELAGGYQP